MSVYIVFLVEYPGKKKRSILGVFERLVSAEAYIQSDVTSRGGDWFRTRSWVSHAEAFGGSCIYYQHCHDDEASMGYSVYRMEVLK